MDKGAAAIALIALELPALMDLELPAALAPLALELPAGFAWAALLAVVRLAASQQDHNQQDQ